MFLNSIKTNDEIPVSGTDGIMAMVIASAANKSLAKNRPVLIEEFITQTFAHNFSPNRFKRGYIAV